MRSADRGATWTTPVKPRDDGWVCPGCPHAGPSMRVDRLGVVHIAWWTGREGGAGVWYARSRDGGSSWVPMAIDTASTSAPAHVQLAVTDSGDVLVAWDDGKATLPGILLRASADGGNTFAAAVRMSDDHVAGTFPVLGVHHDSVTVAWSQTADAAYREAMAARPDMKNPDARMGLPRVGQQEVLARTVSIRSLRPDTP
jgi:hypothetical protein